MSISHGANQYKKTSVKTAGRGQILIMLYEAVIQNVKKATVAIEKNDIASKGQSIVKAHEIINELINTLDFEVGGKIAEDLEKLYHFMIEQLIQANIENKKEPLLTIARLLETLLSAWKIAVQEANKGSAK